VGVVPGAHVIEPSSQRAPMRVLDFNGDLKTAAITAGGVEFAYKSNARAMALLERAPARLEIDGVERAAEMSGNVLLLPRGQHLVNLIPGK